MARGRYETALKSYKFRLKCFQNSVTRGGGGLEAPFSTDIFLFERFRLDRHGLFRRDEGAAAVPVEIGRRALDVLGVLLGRPGDLLARDEIVAAVWPTTVVEDNNLNMQIAALRRVLDQDRAQGSCIQTVPGRGYRFVAPVKRVEPATPPVFDGSGRSIVGNGQSRVLGAVGQIDDLPQVQTSRRRHQFWGGVTATVIGALVLVVAVAVGIWHSPWFGDANPAPRLSFVVLPFANLSNDPDQVYFADGITDDLTTDLSRISGSFVIARNTAFTYKGKSVDAKQIGRDLGVRYVIEGSVRRADDQVQVNVQLIDAETGAHLWADRFDTDRTNLKEAQNEITGRLAKTLNVELFQAASRGIEQERATDPDARDFAMRAWARVLRGPPSPATFEEALRLNERALERDPESVEAKINMASILVGNLSNGWSSSIRQDQEQAEKLLLGILERDPNNTRAHGSLGILRRVQNRLEEARIEFETAIALDRNNTMTLRNLGGTLIQMGKPEEAIPYIEKSVRLSPHDPGIGNNYGALGQCHLFLGHLDRAIEFLRRASAANPRAFGIHLNLAGALGLRGDLDEARAEVAEALKLKPEVNSLAALRAHFPWITNPPLWALRETTVNVGLRRAGFLDE